jgi:hypothetical protein
MTREEFINLEVGDVVCITRGKADKGKLCEVTEIFPMWPELRERVRNGKVTAKVLDGKFDIGNCNPDGSKTLNYRGWKKVSNFVLKFIK